MEDLITIMVGYLLLAGMFIGIHYLFPDDYAKEYRKQLKEMVKGRKR